MHEPEQVPSTVPSTRPSTGQHRLGPHVVGQRVVVRRLVPGEVGPTGGPAFTDALGTCTGWYDDHLTLLREDGEELAIPLALVVSGKPVPPRPGVRARVTPDEAQRRALALFPDVATVELGGWLLRSSATEAARRANSVLALGPAADGLAGPDPVAAVAAHYDGLGRRPVAAVLADSPEEALFRSAGWVEESADADTLFQLAGVASARRRLPRHLPEASVLPRADGLVEVVLPGARAVAAYADDWVGFRGLEVDPDRRGQGLGLAVVAQVLAWGAERGATTAYLQVLGDGAAALRLYEGVGFTTHHAYRYLAPA